MPNPSTSLPVQRCAGCGAATLPRYAWCPHCRSTDLTPDHAGPGGTLYSFTEVRTAEPPYTLAYVDLDGGLRILGRVAEPTAGVACGERVTLRVDGAHVTLLRESAAADA